MWIQVRSMDGKQSVRIDGLSKLSRIEDLREKLVEPFQAEVERQRLFYRGKQLVDGHTLFDYSVGLNEIIQVMVRAELPAPANKIPAPDEDKENQEPNVDAPLTTPTELSSQDSGFDEELDSIYKVGDIIDAREEATGAWFEARIVKVCKSQNTESKHDVSAQNVPVTVANNLPLDKGKKGTVHSEMDKKEMSDPENLDCNKENIMTNMNDVAANGKKEIHEGADSSNSKENDCNGNVITSTKPCGVEIEEPSKQSDSVSMETEEPSSQSESVSLETQKLADGLKCPWDTELAQDDGMLYTVMYEGYEDDDAIEMMSRAIRPRARHQIPFTKVEIGDKVMVNYNYDEPEERGFWYDAIVTAKRNTRTIKEVQCTVFIGKDLVPMKDCLILFRDDIFELEEPGTQMNIHTGGTSPKKRINKPACEHCHDNPRRKCKECSCHVCGGKEGDDKTLMCDECDLAFHIYCLDPPLEAIPEEDEWYCPLCKNDASEVVQAGEKLKESKKKSKMASASNKSTRDWGKGMACVGRTKVCTIVPPNHFGPIPGIEVGSLWKYRVQVSEAGVHRPHVAGIHGREEEGSYSIVLGGGYEDDQDDGEEFTYTGSGGRDLSGNKRTSEQSCDQTLTRFNLALARNCNCPANSKTGGDAGDSWKKGKPCRVVRNDKGRKHSQYAPEEGNRYDGIYKIVKYWPEKGKSGFIVWRYMMRRDDPIPAPWTKAGKKRIAELGLTMQYPEGYLEAQAEKEKKKAGETPKGKSGTPKRKMGTPKGGRKNKRKRVESDQSSDEETSPLNTESPVKKKRVVAYKVDEEVAKLIEGDTANKNLWDEALGFTKEGAQALISKVEETFSCICCQDIVYLPITTECSHNICKSCLSRSFKAEVYNCPACRHELGEKYSMATNKNLTQALRKLFPGYENGRD